MITGPVTLGARRYAPSPIPYSAEQRDFLVLAMVEADFAKLAVRHGRQRRRWFAAWRTPGRVLDERMLPVLAATIVREGEPWTVDGAHETALHLAGLRDRREHELVFRMFADVLARFALGSAAGALMREAAEITLTS